MSNVYSYSSHSYRSIFISDVHLGTKDCKAEYLSNFLKNVECEHLYLVGDIVDIWNMKNAVHWSAAQNDVVRTILKKSKNGTKVIYVPGNHDEVFREYVEYNFGDIEIHKRLIHTTANKRQLLVLHGDEFDSVMSCNKIMSHIGDFAYDGLLFVNRVINKIRHNAGLPYWSLASNLKLKVKNARTYIEKFENAATLAAKHDGLDGVICGHIHHAEIKQLNDIVYYNTGDWVENCTAITEMHNGELNLIHYSEKKSNLKSDRLIIRHKLKQTA